LTVGQGGSSPQLSRQDAVEDRLGFEDESFENMVLHHRRALIRINAGTSSRKVLSKRERECMRKLGILLLTSSQGRRYVLSLGAKRVLGISV
jgi:hypothetical protein